MPRWEAARLHRVRQEPLQHRPQRPVLLDRMRQRSEREKAEKHSGSLEPETCFKNPHGIWVSGEAQKGVWGPRFVGKCRWDPEGGTWRSHGGGYPSGPHRRVDGPALEIIL